MQHSHQLQSKLMHEFRHLRVSLINLANQYGVLPALTRTLRPPI